MTDLSLPQLRHQLGLSQAAFARRLGYQREYIAHIECGAKPVSLPLADRVSRFFGAVVSLSRYSLGLCGEDCARIRLGALLLQCCAPAEDVETCQRMALRFSQNGWPWRHERRGVA